MGMSTRVAGIGGISDPEGDRLELWEPPPRLE
jgi:hypothetical protein